MEKVREYMKIGIIAATLLFGSVSANAGVVKTARITRIEAQSSGRFFVYLSSPTMNSPTCASQPANAFVVNAKSDAGNVVVALITLAYTLQKPVHIQGTGTCALGTNVEMLSDISTLDEPVTGVRPGIQP
jgi:hypothetical protein